MRQLALAALFVLLFACGKNPPTPAAPTSPMAPVAPLAKTSPTPVPGSVAAKLERVSDGDTITLADQTRVRYLGIDTPELKDREPFAKEATERNKALLDAGELRIIPRKKDVYDRTLATVLAGGVDVVETLLREGLGWLYADDLDAALRERYLTAQRAAMDAGRGLWPHLRAATGKVIANTRSGVFHSPG